MGEFTTFSFGGTSLIDMTSYLAVSPDLDAMVQQSIDVVRGHHAPPTFGKPTPLERVVTMNCSILPTGGDPTKFFSFDDRLDALKQVLDTSEGTKQLIVQRKGGTSRYLNCHVRQFAVNRIERKVTWQFVAADPYWRSVTLHSDTQTITSTGTQFTLTNAGTKFAKPKFTLQINTANLNSWLYHKRVLVRNTMFKQPLPAGYTLDLTNGGWDTATLVSGGKMKADGSDLRVEFDGKEIPRYLDAINTASTKVWVNLPVALPALNPDNSGGEFVKLGYDLAPGTRGHPTPVASPSGITGTNNLENAVMCTWDKDGYPADASKNLLWVSNASASAITIDLGAAKKFNRVAILQLADGGAAKDFTIQGSANNVAWDTLQTVTGSTVRGKYLIFDFTTDQSYRYVKIDITAPQVGGAKVGLNKVQIYMTTPRLLVKYGNAAAGTPSWAPLGGDPNTVLPPDSVAFTPLFDPSQSTNGKWVYTQFQDTTPEGKYRTMQWTPVNQYNQPQSKTYTGAQDQSVDPVTALGITQNLATGLGGFDAWRIFVPCGIRAVNHTGQTKHNNAKYRWRQLSKTKRENTPIQDWQNNVNTSAGWSYYSYKWTSYKVPSEDDTKYYIYFNLQRIASDASNQHYGEASQVTLLLNPAYLPTVTFGTEITSGKNWQATIRNTTNNQAISFSVTNIPATTPLVIDCDTKDIYRSDTGESFMQGLEVNSVRQQWFQLDPGANVLQWDETGIQSVQVVSTWEDRWL